MTVSCCTWTQLVQWPLWLQRIVHLLQQSGNPRLQFSHRDSISASACVQQTQTPTLHPSHHKLTEHTEAPSLAQRRNKAPATPSHLVESYAWPLHVPCESSWPFQLFRVNRGLAQCQTGPSRHTWQHLWPVLDVTINIPILTSCYNNFRLSFIEVLNAGHFLPEWIAISYSLNQQLSSRWAFQRVSFK